MGTYLLLELDKLRQKFPTVGDVRGKGLMIGVELVNGDDSTAPLPADKFLKLWEHCRDLGLIVGKGGQFGNVRCKTHLRIPTLTIIFCYLLQVLRIKPPMCITKADADFTVQVLEDALGQLN